MMKRYNPIANGGYDVWLSVKPDIWLITESL